MSFWLWQSQQWPHFTWQQESLQPLLAQCQHQLGLLCGLVRAEPESLPALDTLLSNILTSSEIEGETLNAYSVRSSLARHLGIAEPKPYPTSKHSDGVAQLLLDAIENALQPLSMQQLFCWHEWLFADEDNYYSQKIRVGELRGYEPMQVVSGRLDNPKVHYQAVPRERLDAELASFITWFNQPNTLDPLLRAGLAHLWFVSIHPFDDGNGRLTRALTDKALAQAFPEAIRLFALSSAILADRKNYYRLLEHTQKIADPSEPIEITEWLAWFLQTLNAAVNQSIKIIERTLEKTRFWQKHRQTQLNPDQQKVLNRMLDGEFSEGISASQYQKVAKVSKATATRHLSDLLSKNVLEQKGEGRSTRYIIRMLNQVQHDE